MIIMSRRYGGDVVHTFWNWVVQATRGLDVMHQFGIVHRNLKGKDVFLFLPSIFYE